MRAFNRDVILIETQAYRIYVGEIAGYQFELYAQCPEVALAETRVENIVEGNAKIAGRCAVEADLDELNIVLDTDLGYVVEGEPFGVRRPEVRVGVGRGNRASHQGVTDIVTALDALSRGVADLVFAEQGARRARFADPADGHPAQCDQIRRNRPRS